MIREDESATFEAAQKTKLVLAEKQPHAKAVDLKNARRRKRIVADIRRINNDLEYVDKCCQVTRRASKMNRYKVFRERIEDEITRHERDEDTTASFEEEEKKLLQIGKELDETYHAPKLDDLSEAIVEHMEDRQGVPTHERLY